MLQQYLLTAKGRGIMRFKRHTRIKQIA